MTNQVSEEQEKAQSAKLGWQEAALILIAVIAAFQTFQLAMLKSRVSMVSTGGIVESQGQTPSGGGMVGGC